MYDLDHRFDKLESKFENSFIEIKESVKNIEILKQKIDIIDNKFNTSALEIGSSVKNIEISLVGGLSDGQIRIGLLEECRNLKEEISELKKKQNEIEPKVNDVFTFKGQILKTVGTITVVFFSLIKFGGWLLGFIFDSSNRKH